MSKKIAIIVIITALAVFIGQIVLVDILDIDMGILNSIFRYGSSIAIFAGAFVAIMSSQKAAKKKDNSDIE